jgi:hypothetical protein
MSPVLLIAVLAGAILLWPLWGRRGPWQAIAFTVVLGAVTALTTLTILGRPAAPDSISQNRESGRPTSIPSPTAIPTAILTATPAVRLEPTASHQTGSERFVRYDVGVGAGQYRLFRIDANGTVTDSRLTSFDHGSHAPVDRIEAPGQVHWRTIVGGLSGWSYVSGDSGSFTIREVYADDSGRLTYRELGSTDQ